MQVWEDGACLAHDDRGLFDLDDVALDDAPHVFGTVTKIGDCDEEHGGLGRQAVPSILPGPDGPEQLDVFPGDVARSCHKLLVGSRVVRIALLPRYGILYTVA